MRTIAFPAISTGAYDYPIRKAAAVALGTVREFLVQHDFLQILLVLFSESDLKTCEEVAETEFTS